MAPSRGISFILRRSRNGVRHLSSFPNVTAGSENLGLSFVSTSRDPYLNLSIEHYLLQKSPPGSNILFIYTNRPSIIIGRNQNPWVEVNLGLLNAKVGPRVEPGPGADGSRQQLLGNVDLVRRRSGGGTVFHDEGNVNWSLICHPSSFTRDKHAEMVVRTLRKLGIDRARVNERHDIVLDQGTRSHTSVDAEDTHMTAYMPCGITVPQPIKVSGSAYKLTRDRALHHGTCLLTSPNLDIIPHYLHSPARDYIKARGVESVRSPVGNIGIPTKDFISAVQQEFTHMYGLHEGLHTTVGKELLDLPEIYQGYQEIKSLDWVYNQTPQFALFNRPLSGLSLATEVQSAPSFPSGNICLTFKHGEIVDTSADFAVPSHVSEELDHIKQTKIYNLSEALGIRNTGGRKGMFARWLLFMLQTPSPTAHR